MEHPKSHIYVLWVIQYAISYFAWPTLEERKVLSLARCIHQGRIHKLSGDPNQLYQGGRGSNNLSGRHGHGCYKHASGYTACSTAKSDPVRRTGTACVHHSHIPGEPIYSVPFTILGKHMVPLCNIVIVPWDREEGPYILGIDKVLHGCPAKNH